MAEWEEQEDKGVLSAYQSLYKKKRKPMEGLLLKGDPRYFDSQLIVNAFACSFLPKAVSVPLDLLGQPWSKISQTVSVLLRDTNAWRQSSSMFRALVIHSMMKHTLLLYTYERTKVFISNEKGINGTS